MSARVDSWIWAIRLTKTRSAAGAACRAGHVRVNGATAKPAHRLAIGDEVQVRLHGQERVVEVTKMLSKRGSAAVAADCYIDHSPPPPPREVRASQPRRDPGAGRPTKRERRELDRLRSHRTLLVALAACLALVLSACGSDPVDPATPAAPQAPGAAGSGPDFGECGRVTGDEVREITQLPLPVEMFRNPSVCEWNESPARDGATASFNWYRGSPYGRERALVMMSRNVVEEKEIAGYPGYASYTDRYGLCEVAIDFGADFILWSLRGQTSMLGEELTRNEDLCAAAERLTEIVVERAS